MNFVVIIIARILGKIKQPSAMFLSTESCFFVFLQVLEKNEKGQTVKICPLTVMSLLGIFLILIDHRSSVIGKCPRNVYGNVRGV